MFENQVMTPHAEKRSFQRRTQVLYIFLLIIFAFTALHGSDPQTESKAAKKFRFVTQDNLLFADESGNPPWDGYIRNGWNINPITPLLGCSDNSDLKTKAQEEIPDLSQVKILTNHVRGNIYMLEATGDVAGNIAASIGPEGILLVDTQFAPLSELILEALRKVSDKPIKYIINTHHHIDHTHGNPVLGKATIIIAHANAYKRLSAMPAEGRPAITFTRRLSLFFNGEEINIIHYPSGHTDNDVVIFFTKSNVVHLGDLWNSGILSFPTVDLESGGSIMGMLRNIESLIKIIPKDAKIIPGHYAQSDLKALDSTREMLLETIGIVSRKKASGKSLNQIQKEGFPPEYNDWGKAYTDAKTWIENIYLGLDQIN